MVHAPTLAATVAAAVAIERQAWNSTNGESRSRRPVRSRQRTGVLLISGVAEKEEGGRESSLGFIGDA